MSFVGKLFDKKPRSTNQNFKLLTGMYSPQAQQGIDATSNIFSLLTGKGDVAGAQAGFDNYLQNAGYEGALSDLTRGITGGAAARGLLRSGSTGQAYLREGTKLNQQMFNNYLENLGGLAGIGNQGGQLLVGAGGGSPDSMRSSTGGLIGKGLGLAASLFGSDRRLKENIVAVGTYPNGLPMYEFNYKGRPERLRGVMADDVEKKYPEAVQEIHGFKAVNYAMIGVEMERA